MCNGLVVHSEARQPEGPFGLPTQSPRDQAPGRDVLAGVGRGSHAVLHVSRRTRRLVHDCAQQWMRAAKSLCAVSSASVAPAGALQGDVHGPRPVMLSLQVVAKGQ